MKMEKMEKIENLLRSDKRKELAFAGPAPFSKTLLTPQRKRGPDA